jgi:hypothetical protein
MRPIALFFTAAFGLAVTAASAADYKAGPLKISDPWSRATPEGIQRCRRLHEDQKQRFDTRSADKRIIRPRLQIRGS